MSKTCRGIFFGALFGLTLGSADALEWAKTTLTMKPEPGAEIVRARFEFKNTGKKPVQILEIRTSCGCTEATPSASKFAAGESGGVDVVFTIGQRTGRQEKEITLFTDDSDQPTRLMLNVQLPDAAAEKAAAKG